jgi:Protein of unknown function (DUF4013)
MKYLHAYRYVFDSPRWLQNILLSMVCLFVPVLGQIILYGYHYEMVEVMHLRGPARYPDFDFNRLLHYLLRGAWVFLVMLIVNLPVNTAVTLLAGATGITSTLMQQATNPTSEGVGVVLVVLVCVLVLVLLVGNLIAFLIAVPLALRAGLTQDFRAAFSWPFFRDFVSKMWLETILTALFLGVTTTVIVLAGAALLCVGLYPAAAWASFAPPYLYHQLYELYLRRGGVAIPLKTG